MGKHLIHGQQSLNSERRQEFEAIFNPRFIAIVRASREKKVGGLAVHHLLVAGYNRQELQW